MFQFKHKIIYLIDSQNSQIQNMKKETTRQNLQKIREKKGRDRSRTLEKSAENQQETIGQYIIHLGKIIGEGTYGKVYKASKIGSEEQFACKIIKKEKIDDIEIYNKDIAKELYERLITQGQFQLSLQQCPNIAKMYKAQENQKAFYFIMEYCESDLAKLLKKQGFLKQDSALNYFKQTLDGIKHIYEKNAFHRDLKPENLLLKSNTIKISDFGFVKIFTDIDKQCKSGRNKFRAESKVGTYRYMSPDILALLSAESNDKEENYSPQKSDIWSLGVILYKMLYGKQPYEGRNPLEMIKKISSGKLSFPDSIEFPPKNIIKTDVSKEIIRLIKKMLIPEQDERISFLKLYSKATRIIQERRQKEKLKSGFQDSANISIKGKDEASQNKQQRLLSVLNQIIVRVYRDLSTFATLREIGITNYSQFSYKIMTLIHEKRLKQLQKFPSFEMRSQAEKIMQDQQKGSSQQLFSVDCNIDEKIKHQILQYQNIFYEQIKSLSNLKPQENLKSVLKQIYSQMEQYEDFEMLIKEVQLFLLFLLQLLCLELGIIKQEFICATNDKADNLKSKSIENFKNDALALIRGFLQTKAPQNQSKKYSASLSNSQENKKAKKSSSKKKSQKKKQLSKSIEKQSRHKKSEQ